MKKNEYNCIMKTAHKLLLLITLIFSSLDYCHAQSDSTVEHTGNFTLIDGMVSMEYHFLEFKSAKGDSIYSLVIDTCLTPTGYRELWDTGGPPDRISPQLLNKHFKLWYTMLHIPGPYSDDQTLYGLKIRKMELIK
jgi:hypothetical protein